MTTLIQSDALALSAKRGRVYGPLNLAIGDGVTVLSGRGGSGRTSLLLTIAGRMRPSSGTLTVLGRDRPTLYRRATAIAGFHEIDDLEGSVSVGATIRERASFIAPWYHGTPRIGDEQVTRLLRGAFGDIPIPGAGTANWDLDETQTMLLRIALALMSKPRILVVDDIDRLGNPAPVWERLEAIAASGTAVVASADPGHAYVPAGATVIPITPHS